MRKLKIAPNPQCGCASGELEFKAQITRLLQSPAILLWCKVLVAANGDLERRFDRRPAKGLLKEYFKSDKKPTNSDRNAK